MFRVPVPPGKSWNFLLKIPGPGKSWKNIPESHAFF